MDDFLQSKKFSSTPGESQKRVIAAIRVENVSHLIFNFTLRYIIHFNQNSYSAIVDVLRLEILLI